MISLDHHYERILITGANGVLGREFRRILANRGDYGRIRFTDLTQDNDTLRLDISNRDDVVNVIRDFQPDCILNLAAMTDVDRCELDPLIAQRINVSSVQYLAAACSDFKIRLVHISSGQIFNGRKESGYLESDDPDPINTYGKTKRDSERILRQLNPKAYIVRTAWLIGGDRNANRFVPALIRKMQTESEIEVVDDKDGSPTFAADLAPAIWQLIHSCPPGIYHLVNRGSATRYQVALMIRSALGLSVTIKPVSSAKFILPAARPNHEILSSQYAGAPGFPVLPEWKDSLSHYLELWRDQP